MSRKSSKKPVAKRTQEDIIIATLIIIIKECYEQLYANTYLQAMSNILEKYTLSK